MSGCEYGASFVVQNIPPFFFLARCWLTQQQPRSQPIQGQFDFSSLKALLPVIWGIILREATTSIQGKYEIRRNVDQCWKCKAELQSIEYLLIILFKKKIKIKRRRIQAYAALFENQTRLIKCFGRFMTPTVLFWPSLFFEAEVCRKWCVYLSEQQPFAQVHCVVTGFQGVYLHFQSRLPHRPLQNMMNWQDFWLPWCIWKQSCLEWISTLPVYIICGCVCVEVSCTSAVLENHDLNRGICLYSQHYGDFCLW